MLIFGCKSWGYWQGNEKLGFIVSVTQPINSVFLAPFYPSRITNSWKSSLSLIQSNLSSSRRPAKASCLSNSRIFWSNSFLYVTFWNVVLFHDFNWFFRFISLLWSVNPPSVGGGCSPPYLDILLNKWCLNHMFSNRKGWRPSFGRSASNNSGQWSETGRGPVANLLMTLLWTGPSIDTR